MNKIIEWNLLSPEDIEVRPAMTKNGKTTLLLYQDSRCAMRALDEQFGTMGWQMEYEAVGDQIYGKLSIYDDERGIWISKMDTGDESNISEKKGQSSDILKRCAVRWGFARELYTTPRIVVDDDGYGCSGYRVSEIEYTDNRKIKYLKIVNRFGKEVFEWQLDGAVKKELPKEKVDNTDYVNVLTTYCSQLKNAGYNTDTILKFFNYYKAAIEKGWRGHNFNVEAYWNRWNTPKEKAA